MIDERKQAADFTLSALQTVTKVYPTNPDAIVFAALAYAHASVLNGAKQLEAAKADGTAEITMLKETWGENDREALKKYLNEMLELLA